MMKIHRDDQTYTTEEINSNINKLNAVMEDIMLKRKELNHRAHLIRLEITKWQEMPTNQLKMF